MNGAWRIPPVAVLVMALVLVGCGGGGGGGGDGGDSSLPDRAEATSEDEDGATFPLQAGRYRLSYRAPGCEDVVIQITGADGTVVYDQEPRGYTSFVNDVAEGEYTIAVTSDCDEWTVNLNKF